MKFTLNLDKKKKFLINFSYFTVWTIIIYVIFKITAVYLLPFLIGLIIAYAVQKPANYLSHKLGFKRQICAAVLSVLFYIIIVAILALLIWILYSQSNKLIKLVTTSDAIGSYVNNIVGFVSKIFEKYNNDFNHTIKKFTDETTNGFVLKISAFLSNGITSFVKKVPVLLISSVVTVVATCYIAKDFDRLKVFVKGFISKEFYKRINDIKNVFINCFFKFFVGYFWLYIITFAELLIGLMLLGVKNFIAIAFLISIIDLLPVFGTGAVLLPWASIQFIQQNYRFGIGLTIVYIVIVIIRNFLEPKIIGKQIGINPLFTLVFIFLGLKLGGIIGMIVLPIILTVLFTYCRQQIANNK